MSSATLFALTGTALFALGVCGLLLKSHLIRKIVAFNIMGSGSFLTLVGLAQREASDPVPQALVLTGIVVALAATALALALARRLLNLTGSMRMPRRDADD